MSSQPASSNWFALQKTLQPQKRSKSNDHIRDGGSRKRRKVEKELSVHATSPAASAVPLAGPSAVSEPLRVKKHKNGESIQELQHMILGNVAYTAEQQLPGKYIALDCEMVGIGINGAESSLARVSLVNFNGAVLLDEFVRQRERVVDYRTQYSGIRETDMIKALQFEDVQKRVAALLKDRILIGHAVHNDLKALLLSHARTHTRDTQICAYKFGVTKSKRPALRVLVKGELGLQIQTGEHSSVTDARATMALFRLHKDQWERSAPLLASVKSKSLPAASKKRKRIQTSDDEAQSEARSLTIERSSSPPLSPQSLSAPKMKAKEESSQRVKEKSKKADDKTKKKKNGKTQSQEFPGGGRKGVSSGLSTIVVKAGKTVRTMKSKSHGPLLPLLSGGTGPKIEWWKQLPGVSSQGSKGTMRL